MESRQIQALPLYAQVKEMLVRDIVAGRWRAGAMLPSENELAVEFNVSQGTVRKALDSLADENVILRRQGLGTFIAERTVQQSLFHFFHFASEDDSRITPTSETLAVEILRCPARSVAELELAEGAEVIRIRRIRKLQGKPALFERIFLPRTLFDGLAGEEILPDALYNLYESRFDITIHRAHDRLRADLADAEDAAALGIATGVPLLEAERTAFTLAGRPVEHRYTRCDTRLCHYFVNLN